MNSTFDLSIENLYKDQATPVLYIVSEERDNDASQNIRFRIVNSSEKTAVIEKRTEDAEPHFEFCFRQSTLFFKKGIKSVEEYNKEKKRYFIDKFKTALKEALPETEWEVDFKVPTKRISSYESGNSEEKSAEIISMKLVSGVGLNLEAGEEIRFTIKGISAEASIGSRSTNVNFVYNKSVANQFQKEEQLKHLDIINHDGKTFAPLEFLILGSPTLVHRTKSNDVRIQMIDTGGNKINVNENTSILFKFSYYRGSYDPNYHPAWIFGEANFVNNIKMVQDLKETTVLLPHTPKDIEYQELKWGYRILSYNFTKAQEIDQLILLFKDVPAEGPVGEARIKISVSNLPGYWDTDFEVKLDKTLLSTQYYEPWKRSYGMLSEQVIVGQSLPNGWQMDNAMHSSLSVTSANIKDESPDSAIDKLVSLHDSKEGMGGLYISVGNWEEGQEWQNWMQGGRIGPEPKRPESSNNKGFVIHADQYNYGTRFQVDFLGNVMADGNISSHGRFKDKTGDVMPVGSIIAFGGKNTPEGWLICDGRSIASETIYADLRTVVGDTIPDLRSRFIVGSGQSNGLSNYIIGAKGGDEKHILKTNEMPSHTHPGITNYDGAHEHTNLRWRWCDYDEDDTPVLSRDSHNPETDNKKGTVGSEGSAHQHNFTTYSTGGDQPHNNLPPYYALTYIIKY